MSNAGERKGRRPGNCRKRALAEATDDPVSAY
jgi:hypothetical protein